MKTYRSYALAVRLGSEPPLGLFFDAADPYHYLRRHPTADGMLWIVGGGDHVCGKGSEAEALADLERWTRERFDVRELVAQWSAQVYEPADDLPYIGRTLTSHRIWFATGYAGDGMTFGTLAAKLLAELVQDRTPDGAELYSPPASSPAPPPKTSSPKGSRSPRT
jgi:glycine/D-amino acid oxidase-like deaminating enzyme